MHFLKVIAKKLKSSIEATALICASLFLVSLLIFSVFEFFPSLLHSVNLQKIRYYAQKTRFIPDPVLVFVHPKEEQKEKRLFKGDLFHPEFGYEAPLIEYEDSQNNYGFRPNSSTAPFDILLIGDSYIQFGEADHLTLSEQLRHLSGLSIFNMGRGFYGPEQYNELFRQYASKINPKIAVYAFFAGNDIGDIKQYKKWLSGGDYWGFVISGRSFFERYRTAITDTISFMFEFMKQEYGLYVIPLLVKIGILKDQQTVEGSSILARRKDLLGVIRIGDQSVPMAFAYWNESRPAEQLILKEEWIRLRTLLLEFKEMALKQDIKPIIIYLPTKLQVYGSQFTEQSHPGFLKRIRAQLVYENNTESCLSKIVHDLDIPYLNILPHFKDLAKEGELLYYPFDTHWNVEGRKAGAKKIFDFLVQKN